MYTHTVHKYMYKFSHTGYLHRIHPSPGSCSSTPRNIFLLNHCLRSLLFIKDDSFMQLNVLDNNRILNHFLLVTFFHSFFHVEGTGAWNEESSEKFRVGQQKLEQKESRPTDRTLGPPRPTTPHHHHHHHYHHRHHHCP